MIFKSREKDLLLDVEIFCKRTSDWCRVMTNLSIHDILDVEISELSTHQLTNLEQKLMRSKKKLPVFLAENIITDSQHFYFLEKLKTRYENPEKIGDTTSCQKQVLDFIREFYPSTTINSLIKLCRFYLCHDTANYMENMLRCFIQDDENDPIDELYNYGGEKRWFTYPRLLSQQKNK